MSNVIFNGAEKKVVDLYSFHDLASDEDYKSREEINFSEDNYFNEENEFKDAYIFVEKRADKNESRNRDEELLELERKAYEKGFTQGEAAGVNLGLKKMEVVLENFMVLTEELQNIKKKICENSEKELLELSLSIARKVLHEEIKLNSEVIMGIMKDSIAKASTSSKIKIRVNRSDMEFAILCKPELIRLRDGIETIIFEEDETVSKGGCIVETDCGYIDGRVESQIEEINDRLLPE